MNTTSSTPNSPLSQGAGSTSPRRAARGFTLVELAATLAVLSVTLAIGVPPLTALFDSIKLRSISNSFVSHLYLARSEAIKRNSRVVLCKSSDGQSCSTSGGWEQGWIVFHDANNNGTREADEVLIEREQALPANLRLTGNLNVVKYLSFASTGATKLIGGGFQAGTLTLCHLSSSAGEARQIILNAVGRPRTQKVAVDSCM